eukprot:2595705-Pleurochrysis_carterae.AAC.1
MGNSPNVNGGCVLSDCSFQSTRARARSRMRAWEIMRLCAPARLRYSQHPPLCEEPGSSMIAIHIRDAIA